jgi:hypothetical protein
MHHRLVTRTNQLAMPIPHSTSSTRCVNWLVCRFTDRLVHVHKSAQPMFTNQLVLLKYGSAMQIRTRSARYADTHTDQLRHSCLRKHPSAKIIDTFIDQLGSRCTHQSAKPDAPSSTKASQCTNQSAKQKHADN